MADLVYPPVIGLARSWFKYLGVRFDIEGTENVPREGGAVLVCNHISYLDFVFSGYIARPSKRLVRFMAKDAVFRHKISGPLMRGMKHIPVDRSRGEAAYAEAVRALRAGEVIGVFPEATISQSFTLKDFKTGAARMAQEAGVPLIPMALWGTQRMWTKGRKRDFGRNHLPVAIRIGEPLTPGADEPAVKVTERLRASVQEQLDAAQAAYPDVPAGPEDSWWQPAHLGGSAPERPQARGRQ